MCVTESLCYTAEINIASTIFQFKKLRMDDVNKKLKK